MPHKTGQPVAVPGTASEGIGYTAGGYDHPGGFPPPMGADDAPQGTVLLRQGLRPVPHQLYRELPKVLLQGSTDVKGAV